MIKSPKKKLQLLLPLNEYEKLKTLADGTSRTIPSYLRMMIYNYLHQLDAAEQTENWWVVK